MKDWPKFVRGIPNVVLRSALFGSSRSADRSYLNRAKIFTQKPVQMLYSGPLLGQGELDAWITLLHISRKKLMGSSFTTSFYELLQLQQKADTGKNIETLRKRLDRLMDAKIEINTPRYTYTGRLIDSIFRDKITHELQITLNRELLVLFEDREFTRLDWQIRRSLNSKPLAQWLHGFLSTHAEPIPLSIETLMRMAGSLDASATSREQNLRRALDAVQLAFQHQGKTFSYEICGAIVRVRKTPSDSQKRHLDRKTNSSRAKKSTDPLARHYRSAG